MNPNKYRLKFYYIKPGVVPAFYFKAYIKSRVFCLHIIAFMLEYIICCQGDSQDNIRRFYTRLEAAAVKSGRKLSDISVVAAIKSQPEEIINNLKSLGIDAVGDNRVQELIRRYNPGLGLKWHFIGQLQTNKVKYIIDKVDLIHSLDRLPLLEKLDKEALKSGKKVNALIEVNAGGEPNKGGIEPSGVIEFARLKADNTNVTIRGS